MRIRRLDLQAIGPFAGQCFIDFDRLGASGLYLLDGPTGSGKSTIIDAITFALYGSVAGGDDSSNDRIRSTHAEPTVESYVDLVFTVSAGTYRVRRTPKWFKPGRQSAVNATAKLWKLEDGALESGDIEAGHVLETKAKDAGTAITDIIGLNKAQFVQTIVLPQGKFAEFLKLGSVARTNLLEQIFDTSIYRAFAEDLTAMASKAGKTIEAKTRAFQQAAGTLISVLDPGADTDDGPDLEAAIESLPSAEDAEPLLGMFEDRVSAAAERSKRAQSVRSSAEAKLKVAANALVAEQELATNLERRTELIKQQKVLDHQLARMLRFGQDLDKDRHARQILPYVKAAEEAAKQKSEATKALADATSAAEHEVNDEYAATLTRHLNELRSQTGSLHELERIEHSIAKDSAKQQQDCEKLEDLSKQEKATAEAAGAIPEKLRATQEAKDRAAALAATVPAATAALASASGRAEEFGKLVKLRAEVTSASAEAATAAKAVGDAQEGLGWVTEMWIASTAANLALEMEEGQPCPVCGSTEHPAPAPQSEDSASRQDVEAATTLFNRKKSAFDKATSALEALRGRAATMEEIHVGETEESLEQAISDARASLAAAQEAEREQHTHSARLTQLASEQEELAERLSTLRSGIAALNSTISSRREQIETSMERVEAGRGEHPSVAERLTEHEAQIEAADTELAAVQKLIAATEAQAQRDEELAGTLASSRFTSGQEVKDALVSPDDATAWEREISDHHDQQRDINNSLKSAPLADLTGEEIPKIAEATEANSQAEEAARQAQSAAADSASLATQSRLRFEDAKQSHATWVAEEEKAGPIIRLAALAAGNRQFSLTGIPLATYVLQQRFEQVVQRANEHLSEISLGRYELQTTEEKESGTRQQKVGLGLQILDHQGESGGDSIRATRTLSGGETFYVALSLALALADVVCAENGGIQLDTLLIDEGFGSLDESTLDQVMQVLMGLASGGRSVGLVSHVSEMKKMVPEQITVIPQPDGSSKLEIRA
ncbi:MAG: AAA family ATPase [Ancrocorticia sp.]|uniref:AAA family ATPase n=1 Tax=Ancrocorticia sp. TaxID=2593684 RepID=UPI003F8EC52E